MGVVQIWKQACLLLTQYAPTRWQLANVLCNTKRNLLSWSHYNELSQHYQSRVPIFTYRGRPALVFKEHSTWQEVNHAVMIVGFGIDDTTKTSYWIIKNSWNTSWGEQGYARVKVKDDANGNCFINNFVIRSFKSWFMKILFSILLLLIKLYINHFLWKFV